MESKVEFKAADMPDATPLMLQIYLAVGEYETKAISKRTKAALMAPILVDRRQMKGTSRYIEGDSWV
jgi:hypothetical protein